MSRAAALALLRETPLALRQSTLDAWCHALTTDGGVTEALKPQAAARSSRTPSGTVGTFGLVGPIFHRPNFLSFLFGGMSIVEARRALAELMADSHVETIVIEFDTPGGGVDAVEDFAGELRAARQQKPIVALVNTQCCSAGYWLAASCTEILITPSGETGSVGVFICHGDYSKQNEMLGYKPTYIGAPKYKAAGNPDTPLSDETRQYLQALVETTYGAFVAGIVRGRGRGLTVDSVKKTFGEGRSVDAQDALRRNMIVPYPSAALEYAGAYAKRQQFAADQDYVAMGLRIAERL
jgi:signal peptide peptidase SppA